MRGAPGRDRGHRAGLPRRLLAVARRRTRSASRAARSCRSPINGRHLRRRRHGRGPRRPPGRPGAGPRPRRRVRVAADDPGRDAGGGPAHRGGPPPRGRPPEGHAEECLHPGASSSPRSSSARPSPSSTISRPAPRPPWTSPSQFGQFAQSLSDKVVGQMLGNEGTMTPDVARTYVRHFMVDQLSFDPNMGTTNILSADGPVVLAWGSNELLPVEIAGQKPRHLGQRPLLPAGEAGDQWQDHVPGGHAALDGRRRPTRSCSTAMRRRSTSAAARSPSPTGRSASRAGSLPRS